MTSFDETIRRRAGRPTAEPPAVTPGPRAGDADGGRRGTTREPSRSGDPLARFVRDSRRESQQIASGDLRGAARDAAARSSGELDDRVVGRMPADFFHSKRERS